MLPADMRRSPSIGGSLALRVARRVKSGESKIDDTEECDEEGDGVEVIRASGADVGTSRRGKEVVSFIEVGCTKSSTVEGQQ